MDIFAEIADERHELADLLDRLVPDEWAAQSLCEAWTVRHVVGHLVVPLEVGVAEFGLTVLRCRGDFHRANIRLAAKQADRLTTDLTGTLRAKAEHRFTPPGAGPEAPLTDLLVHGLDIRRPLGIGREIPPERARVALDFLTSGKLSGPVVDGVVGKVTLEAAGLGWTHGEGPVVHGTADDLLLALTGRKAGLAGLDGRGVALLARAIG